MLVLTRKKNDSIVIDGRIRIEVLQVGKGGVRLGIAAPKEVRIRRGELVPTPELVTANEVSESRVSETLTVSETFVAGEIVQTKEQQTLDPVAAAPTRQVLIFRPLGLADEARQQQKRLSEAGRSELDRIEERAELQLDWNDQTKNAAVEDLVGASNADEFLSSEPIHFIPGDYLMSGDGLMADAKSEEAPDLKTLSEERNGRKPVAQSDTSRPISPDAKDRCGVKDRCGAKKRGFATENRLQKGAQETSQAGISNQHSAGPVHAVLYGRIKGGYSAGGGILQDRVGRRSQMSQNDAASFNAESDLSADSLRNKSADSSTGRAETECEKNEYDRPLKSRRPQLPR